MGNQRANHIFLVYLCDQSPVKSTLITPVPHHIPFAGQPNSFSLWFSGRAWRGCLVRGTVDFVLRNKRIAI
jgi:hypothetical protein